MKNITVMHARYGRYNIGGIFANIRMYNSAKIRMYNLMYNFTEKGTTISKELLEKLLENKSTFDFGLKIFIDTYLARFQQNKEEDDTISTFNVNGIIETKDIKHSEESLESMQELYNNLFKEVKIC